MVVVIVVAGRMYRRTTSLMHASLFFLFFPLLSPWPCLEGLPSLVDHELAIRSRGDGDVRACVPRLRALERPGRPRHGKPSRTEEPRGRRQAAWLVLVF